MDRYEQLATYLEEQKEPTKTILLSLLGDFCKLESEIDKLKGYPRYLVDPKDHRRQKKLPVHEILKDLQAQKNDIATKILRTLEKAGGGEDELQEALKEFL